MKKRYFCFMRSYSLLFVVLLYAAGVSGQEIKAPYAGTLKSFSKWYGSNASDSIYGLFNDVMKSHITADKWKEVHAQVKAALGGIGEFRMLTMMQGYAIFVAEGERNSLSMQLALDSAGKIGGLFNKPTVAAAPDYHTNYKVHTPEGDLAGELKRAKSRPPVVLIIAGSGPTDRDGNSGLASHTDCYKLLAEALELEGIASYRYDKRFTGESAHFTERLDSVRFEDFVNDARACVRKLKADTNFSSVIVLGHSEGALIGAIAAREEKADGYISLAGVGVPAEIALRRQLAQGGRTGTGIEKGLDSLKMGNEQYIVSWNRYDPAREVAKLKMPVLIIQGLTDLQVERQDAEKLKKALPRASLVLIGNMNHILKDAPLDRDKNIATYNNARLPLNAQLVPAIVRFISDSRVSR
jgi:pimeloyl-ACP methyl ester carboxylesterase